MGMVMVEKKWGIRAIKLSNDLFKVIYDNSEDKEEFDRFISTLSIKADYFWDTKRQDYND